MRRFSPFLCTLIILRITYASAMARCYLKYLTLGREQLYISNILAKDQLVPFCPYVIDKICNKEEESWPLQVLEELISTRYYNLKLEIQQLSNTNLKELVKCDWFNMNTKAILSTQIKPIVYESHWESLLLPVLDIHDQEVAKLFLDIIESLCELSTSEFLNKLTSYEINFNYTQQEYIRHWLLFCSLTKHPSAPPVSHPNCSPRNLQELFNAHVLIMEAFFDYYDDTPLMNAIITEVFFMTALTKPIYIHNDSLNVIYTYVGRQLLFALNPHKNAILNSYT